MGRSSTSSRLDQTHPERVDVDFFIAYEFRSLTLGLLMGSVFDKAFRRFVAAFELRADAIYGRPEEARA